jgi:hypothetical protein
MESRLACSFFFICNYIYCMNVLSACVSVSCVFQERLERASDPLKLELWVVLSCHVATGNRTCIL